jgi:ribosomal protein S21
LQVFVRDNNVDQALRVLKKKMQREGVFREMKRRRFFEKPSDRATRERPRRSVVRASSPASRRSATVCCQPPKGVRKTEVPRALRAPMPNPPYNEMTP